MQITDEGSLFTQAAMNTPAYELQVDELMARIMAENTGQDFEVIMADTERDNWKSAEEALAYGLIDRIITNHASAV